MKCNFKLFVQSLKIISMAVFLYGGLIHGQVLIRGVVTLTDSSTLIKNVAVKNLDSRLGTNTNDSGFFKILAFTGNVLEFSKTGYMNKKYTVKANENIVNVQLLFSDNPLDEVVVSASKSDQFLKNTSVSIQAIKPYLINNKNPATLENTIDQIPGVQTINGQVVIRSGSGWSYGAGTRVMIMVLQWSFIPVENIESMEVIKGASSVLFGSSALNGVINIITKKPKLKPETKISTFYGFYGKHEEDGLNWNQGKLLSTFGVRAFHSQKKGKNSIALNLNYFNDDSYRMSDLDNRLRVGWQYQRDIKKWNGYAGLNGNLLVGKSSSFLLWENDKLAYTALDSNFTNNKILRFNVDPFLVINKNKWKHLLQGRYLKVSNFVLQAGTGLSQNNFSDLFFGEYQLSRDINKNLRVIGGITATYILSRSDIFQGDNTSQNRAIYVQANQKAGKFNFDAGIRYEYYKLNSYREVRPVMRAGVSRELTKATFLRASFGQGYRFPTVAETQILTTVGPMKIYPNQDLKSETGWNAELGVKQGIKLGKWSGILDVAGFWMKYDRMMEFTFAQWERYTPTGGFGFKSLNVSDAEIKGIDISLAGTTKWKKSELKWLAGYTYAHAVALHPNEVFYLDSFGQKLSFVSTSSNPDGNYLKYRPKHLIRIDVQYELKRWELGASCRYNSYLQNIDKAFVSFPIALVVPGIQKVRDRGKNGDYIIDLRVGKTFRQFKVMLLANNLLNRLYMTRPSDMRPPRSFMLQVNWSF